MIRNFVFGFAESNLNLGEKATKIIQTQTARLVGLYAVCKARWLGIAVDKVVGVVQ